MTEQAISSLRRRMIEDMLIRKLAPKTQHDYVQRVKDFAAFFLLQRDARSYGTRQAPGVHARAAQGT
jgi:integrase/recombinase XerD